MRIFHCPQCEQILYFENTTCLKCHSELGLLMKTQDMACLKPHGEGTYEILTKNKLKGLYKKCRNYSEEKVCNCIMPVSNQKDYCLSCVLNHTIPNLSKKNNRKYWYRLEVAKRRLLYAIIRLELPLVSREEDPEKGLSFQFLEDEEVFYQETKKIITGHTNGMITINIAEADDALRVQMRLKMKEEYRTILGHFRHEIGHYYWARLIEHTPHLENFRSLFGDESENYDIALKRYYDEGAPDNWQDNYVSAYSSSHPWEDWAETWAHYFHIIDTLETAQAWGLSVYPTDKTKTLFGHQTHEGFFLENKWPDFNTMYENWTWMTCAINSMNRSMGQRDFYPFILSQKAIHKLQFIDTVIKSYSYKG